MASITIDLSDSHFRELQELANRHEIAIEVLVKAGVEDWLSAQKSDFVEATNYVLTKNDELYQRLA